MKTLKISLLIVSVFVFLLSCQNNQKPADNLATIEEELNKETDVSLKSSKAENLINAYIEYADQNPDDSLTPDYLEKAAELSLHYTGPAEAANVYKRIKMHYPERAFTAEELTSRINEIEAELFSDQSSGIDRLKAFYLTNNYIAYSYLFKDDELTPGYLFKAADISMNLFESGKSIEIYNRILKDYPDFEKAPQCLFLKAFVYENNMNDIEKARKYYEEFLEKYPDDDFADDAEMSLKNLGKTPEELIKEFEEKQK